MCHAVGVDPARVFARIAEPNVKPALKANTDEVMTRGGSGFPTVSVGGTDMFFGNDRLPLERAAVIRSRGATSGNR